MWCYAIIFWNEKSFFQNNKGNISITTVPCGMGTTTKYTFSLYEGENCIKTSDCSGGEQKIISGTKLKEQISSLVNYSLKNIR